MDFYIKIENNQPIDHPVTEENLIQVFGSVPSNFAPFNRIQPIDSGVLLGVYEKYTNKYTLNSDGLTWQDTWSAIEMDQNEKNKKTNSLIYQVNFILSNFKILAQERISHLTDQNQSSAWETYLSLLDNVVITDPLQVTIPKMPKKDDNGVYTPNVDKNNVWENKILSII